MLRSHSNPPPLSGLSADVPVLSGLKVLQVTRRGISVVKHVRPVADALTAAGCQVEILCCPDPEAEFMAANGYKTYCVEMPAGPGRPVQTARALAAIARIIRAGKYDVVHSHTPVGAFYTNFVAKRAGAPHLFYTMRGAFYVELCNPIKRAFFSRLQLMAARAADRVFVVADHMRRWLVANGYPEDRIVVLNGTGVDHDHLRCSPEQRQHWRVAIRSQYAIPPDAPVIVTVTRLVSTKGVGELIRAMPAVLAAVPDAWLLIVGDGDCRGTYHRLAARCRVARRVVFAGNQHPDRVREFLAAADVFALPTYYHEGLPMAPVEAMAMNLPVILADTPPAHELIEHDLSGVIVPPRQVKPLAEAIIRLLTDRAYARRIAAAGNQVASQFTVARSVRAHLDGYAGDFAKIWSAVTETPSGLRQPETAGE